MNAFQMTTDKVLLTVFVSILVGFLTAAMSIVRLVNDKESKTTDYRQSWTDSLRKCFASLISNINTLASLTASRMSSADGIGDLIDHEMEAKDPKIQAVAEKTRAYLDKRILEEDEHIREIRRAMYESYSLTRLHFKPNDLSFSRVEQKFDVIVELFSKFQSLAKKEDEGERKALREKIRAEANELTAFSRDILKTEWEAVKRGENAYQRTKFWSLLGGAIALVGIFVFGLATAWSFLRADTSTATSTMVGVPHFGASPATTSSGVQSDQTPAPSLSTAQTVNVFGSTAACPPVPRQLPPKTPTKPATCQQ